MKKLLLVIAIFPHLLYSQDYNFSVAVPRLEQVFTNTFSELQEYMRKIERERIVRNLGENCIAYESSENSKELVICVQRKIQQNKITEVVSYLMRGKIYALFSITKEGSEFRPTPNRKLFSFKYYTPFNVGTLTLDSPDMGVFIELKKEKNKDSSTIRTEEKEFRLVMFETREEDSWARQFGINCSNCYGIASMRAELSSLENGDEEP
ncbi:MAG: hypothetical protein HOM21_05450, partial [Halobacteriovoraceae bacterium]|nr:hypothetical protein [Halobacteriovoraceae bacterium]